MWKQRKYCVFIPPQCLCAANFAIEFIKTIKSIQTIMLIGTLCLPCDRGTVVNTCTKLSRIKWSIIEKSHIISNECIFVQNNLISLPIFSIIRQWHARGISATVFMQNVRFSIYQITGTLSMFQAGLVLYYLKHFLTTKVNFLCVLSFHA